ncbi:DNA glycosylase [Phlebopus sp. FC_14]|nr:DNA glycosylase [Phlebopus sp. FC_14]
MSDGSLRAIRVFLTKGRSVKQHRNMPQTRAATRLSTTTPSKSTAKRKAEPTPPSNTPRAKKSKSTTTEAVLPQAANAAASVPPPAASTGQNEEALVPAVLGFSFEDAKAHLVNVDSRFAGLFARLKCKPFEYLEQAHPFRALVMSILGQQISWLAARSIIHKFIRLYDQSLPEKPADYSHTKSATSFFPTPYQVANTEIVTLKTAGLSTRKAEYVKDLAARFADGRLSTSKLFAASDEELAEMLIEVRGIGRWTVDMFAIFTLRRPNVLPVGDLGVQRGMVRWFGGAAVGIKPEKVEGDVDKSTESGNANGGTPADGGSLEVNGKQDTKAGKAKGKRRNTNRAIPDAPATLASETAVTVPGAGMLIGDAAEEGDALPTFTVTGGLNAEVRPIHSIPEDMSSIPPSSLLKTPHASTSTPSSLLPVPSLPKPFTPSIDKVIAGHPNSNLKGWTKTLPDGLTSGILKSRLDGKKVKGAFLTPQEMEVLTEDWVPYRSLGVYYMWALAEEKK